MGESESAFYQKILYLGKMYFFHMKMKELFSCVTFYIIFLSQFFLILCTAEFRNFNYIVQFFLFLKTLPTAQWSGNFSPFMEHKDLLLCSHELAIETYTEQIKSRSHTHPTQF
jgi:hypothetical protein